MKNWIKSTSKVEYGWLPCFITLVSGICLPKICPESAVTGFGRSIMVFIRIERETAYLIFYCFHQYHSQEQTLWPYIEFPLKLSQEMQY